MALFKSSETPKNSSFPKASMPSPAPVVPAVSASSAKVPDDDGFGVPDDVSDNPILQEDAFDTRTKNVHTAESTKLPALSDVISEGTSIDGNFSSEGNIEVRGKIKGDVFSKGYVLLNNAEIEGNVTGIGGVYMKDGFVHGSIKSSENVDVGGRVDGAVSGKTVIVRENGIIHGPYLHCQYITTVTGAQIDCAVKTGYSTDDVDEEPQPAEAKSDGKSDIPVPGNEQPLPLFHTHENKAQETAHATEKDVPLGNAANSAALKSSDGEKFPIRFSPKIPETQKSTPETSDTAKDFSRGIFASIMSEES